MTLPSGPAKAAEASADEAAAETVPWGMTARCRRRRGRDDWSGAASRSGKRGQLAAPAISKERRSALAARGGERKGERERERESAVVLCWRFFGRRREKSSACDEEARSETRKRGSTA